MSTNRNDKLYTGIKQDFVIDDDVRQTYQTSVPINDEDSLLPTDQKIVLASDVSSFFAIRRVSECRKSNQS
jgi:hypothetical protein